MNKYINTSNSHVIYLCQGWHFSGDGVTSHNRLTGLPFSKWKKIRLFLTNLQQRNRTNSENLLTQFLIWYFFSINRILTCYVVLMVATRRRRQWLWNTLVTSKCNETVIAAINTAAYYQRVTTCGSCGTVVRRRRIDNTWPVVALQHAATRYRLRIAISAYPTCIRRLH